MSLAACAAALCLAGCGVSGPTAGPSVGLSITAPTSGATVGVHQVVVAGTVSPATATVLVGGKPTPVVKGSFQRSLRIAKSAQTITVTAQARGYAASAASTTVYYSPKVAAELGAAKQAASSTAAPHFVSAAQVLSQASQVSPTVSGASSKAVNSAFPLTSQSSTTTPTRPTSPTPTPPTTPTNPPSSGGAPTHPAPPTVDEIRQLWEHGCLRHAKGQNIVPWCTCIYTHLQSTGAFNTRASVRTLIKEFRPWSRTGDANALPRNLRDVVIVCTPYLPPLDPITGKPVITRLPGLSHKPIPPPTAPLPR